MTERIVVADWGTSSFRAWLVDGGQVEELVRLPIGVKDKATGSDKAEFLHSTLGPFLEGVSAVEGIGMISSTLGLSQTPYLPTPVSLDTLLNHRQESGFSLTDPTGNDVPIRLGPGVSHERGLTTDIMRGEELQVLSATDGGIAICPGSHSKWVHVDNSHIVGFSTFLTGELFSSLSHHTSLREATDTGDARSEAWGQGFIAGLDQPADTFSRELFAVRARWVSGGDSRWSAGYLSGLVVGLEWHRGLRDYTPERVHLIGSDTTVSLYERAAGHFGVEYCSHPDSVAPAVFCRTLGDTR